MRNVNPYIIGGLIALAIFIICNCAGYLIVIALSPGSEPGGLLAGALAPAPTQAGVVAYVTPTATRPAAAPASPATAAPPTPIPLLPTVTPAPPTPTPTAQPLPPPTNTPAPSVDTPSTNQIANASRLSVVSHHSYVDTLGWYHIVGEVQNNATVPMEFVEVIAKLYDESENVIGTKLTFTAPNVIFPGGRAPFDIIALRRSQWQQIKTYRLQVKGDVSQSLLKENLVLLNQTSYIEDGFLYVEGEVQNTGNTPTLVKLVITLYDADRNVINTNWGYADAGILLANHTSSFEVKINHQTDPNNYHYTIQIEEEAIDTN